MDEQIRANPALVVEARSTENKSRFLSNISILCEYKAAQNIARYEVDRLAPIAAPAGIKCVNYKTFYKALRLHGLRIILDYVPHNCKICLSMSEVNKEIKEGKGDHQMLLQRKKGIQLHQSQLQTQRAEITRIRENLAYDQCLVVMDFGGHYTDDTKKIFQLVFVVFYRNDIGSETWDYYNIWSDERSKWSYVVRAWETLFAKGVFDKYEEIILARDNGHHFRNFNVVKYESEVGWRHKKTFRVRSYAPYHAYSQADGHIAHVKGCIRKASRCTEAFRGPTDFVNHLNEKMKNQCSIELDDKFPVPKDFMEVPTGSVKGIAQITHIDYGFRENGVEYPRARWCARASPHSDPSCGPIFFWDLSGSKLSLCKTCSNLLERPIPNADMSAIIKS